MKKYSGIDLHSNNCVVAVIDEADQVLYRKRLPNELAVFVAALGVYRGELHSVVVESTYNWYWLVDGLMAAGFEVRLANTAAIKQYEGLKHTDDGDDDLAPDAGELFDPRIQLTLPLLLPVVTSPRLRLVTPSPKPS